MNAHTCEIIPGVTQTVLRISTHSFDWLHKIQYHILMNDRNIHHYISPWKEIRFFFFELFVMVDIYVVINFLRLYVWHAVLIIDCTIFFHHHIRIRFFLSYDGGANWDGVISSCKLLLIYLYSVLNLYWI